MRLTHKNASYGIEKGIVAEKSTTAQIDTIPKAAVLQPKKNSVLLRLPEVLAMFPVGRSTWYAGIKAQIYPKPIPISRRSVAWSRDSIDDLIKRQMGA
jgi:predicted DNA-binding transcriptional regulator AlpA